MLGPQIQKLIRGWELVDKKSDEFVLAVVDAFASLSTRYDPIYCYFALHLYTYRRGYRRLITLVVGTVILIPNGSTWWLVIPATAFFTWRGGKSLQKRNG